MPPTETEITTACTSNNHDMLNPTATAPPYSVATPSPHEQEIKSKSLLLGFVSPCSRASSHLVDVFFPPQGN